MRKRIWRRTSIDEFRTQNRGGKGIILIDASERNGPVVGVKLVKDGDEVMLITDRGQTLRTRVDEIRETGRNAQGVKLMTLADGERIVAVERLAAESNDALEGTNNISAKLNFATRRKPSSLQRRHTPSVGQLELAFRRR